MQSAVQYIYKKSVILITYFALKELIVGNNQLFFLGCFGNIFDVSQQLVLIEKLKDKMHLVRRKLKDIIICAHH